MAIAKISCAPALLLTASWTAGAAAAPAVSISYEAPDPAVSASSCPSMIEFLQALEARGADADSPAASARARAIEARIRRIDGAYVGDLIVHTPAGGTPTRTVRDPKCAEVASALALTAAIALGGSADRAGTESVVAVQETQSAPPPPEAAAEEATPSRAPAATDSTPRLRGSSFFGQTDSIPVTAGTLELEGARSYTLTAGVHSGLIPGQLIPRYDLTASLAGFLVPPAGESRLFGPVVQVHWAVLGPVTSRHDGVSLDSWALEAGLDSCSAFTYDSEAMVALLCAEFGVGFLQMEAKAGAAGNGNTQTRGYGFGGLAFDAQYNVSSWAHLGLRLGGRLTTQVEAEGPDGSPLFESSPWAGYATLGGGIHF